MNSVFGEPRKGIHSIRLFDIAIVDLVLTFLAAVFISKQMRPKYSIMTIFAALIVLGIVVHYIARVDTSLNVFLGLGRQKKN